LSIFFASSKMELMDTTEERSAATDTQVELDYSSLTLDLSMTYIRVCPDGPEAFSQDMEVTIFAEREDPPEESDETRVQIGHISATLIRLSDATAAGWDLYTALDAPSHSTSECLELLGDNGEYSAAVQDVLQDEVFWPENILLVERLEIQPEHRGHNAGLYAMRAFIDLLGAGCSVVACKPFPLQFEGKVTDENRKEFLAAQTKLRKYWGRVGFKRVPKTDLCVLSPLLRLPKLPAIV
jgi:hypothetical protein